MNFASRNVMLMPCIVLATALGAYAKSPAVLSQLSSPFIIAHRGSPNLYPEHTLEAYRASLEDGNSFVEVDCFLLADGALGVMHDSTLERTTTGTGNTAAQTVESWRKLRVDGGRILGGKLGMLRVPLLTDVLDEFGNKAILVLEAKNQNSGAAITQLLKERRVSPDMVLINSFQQNELQAAVDAGYHACLNIAREKGAPSPAALKGTGITYLSLHKSFSEEYVQQAKRSGFTVLTYTVNRQYEFSELAKKGFDGFYSDDPVYLSGKGYQRRQDPFAQRTWYHGQLVTLRGTRGGFYPPDKWGLSDASSDAFAGVLQGWCSPLNSGLAYNIMDLDLTIGINRGYTPKHGAVVVLTSEDVDWDDRGTPSRPVRGYVFRIGVGGSLQIDRYDNSTSPETVARTNGAPFRKDMPYTFRISLSGGRWSLTNMDTADGVICSAAASNLTPGYLTFGVQGAAAQFSKVTVSAR